MISFTFAVQTLDSVPSNNKTIHPAQSAIKRFTVHISECTCWAAFASRINTPQSTQITQTVHVMASHTPSSSVHFNDAPTETVFAGCLPPNREKFSSLTSPKYTAECVWSSHIFTEYTNNVSVQTENHLYFCNLRSSPSSSRRPTAHHAHHPPLLVFRQLRTCLCTWKSERFTH